MNRYPIQYSTDFYVTFGAPGERVNLVTIDLPYKLKLSWDETTYVKRMTVHRMITRDVVNAFEEIKKSYGLKLIEELRLNVFGGCYNKRLIRGGDYYSIHSWALAIDFDPKNNLLKWDKKRASLAGPEYEKFWEIWESLGWSSLGREKNYDWMHVQAPKL